MNANIRVIVDRNRIRALRRYAQKCAQIFLLWALLKSNRELVQMFSLQRNLAKGLRSFLNKVLR